MSSKGDCDRERDRRRSSVVPRGVTSVTVDSTHDIEPRNTEDFSHSLGLAVSPLDCDVRTEYWCHCCFKYDSDRPLVSCLFTDTTQSND